MTAERAGETSGEKMTGKKVYLKMVRGILAFEEVLCYTLQPVPDNPLFFWLEAEDGPGFLLTRPDSFFEDYKITMNREDLKDVLGEKDDPEKIEVFVIITVPERMTDMTANLLAPFLINEAEGLACQLVLKDVTYTTRHYLFSPEERRSCG